MIVNTAKVNEAREVLAIGKEYTQRDVETAFRAASKTCHPNGGSHDPALWQRITWAKGLLLKALEAQSDVRSGPPGTCRACGGRGRIQRRSGFSSGITMMCVMCDGSGNAKES